MRSLKAISQTVCGFVELARCIKFERSGREILDPDSGRIQSGIVKTSAQAVGWRTQSGQILRIEGAKRGFDGLADPDNSFFHARTQERNPKVTAKEQLRPTRRRGTARMRRAVTFHPFHRYHCWIKDLLLI